MISAILMSAAAAESFTVNQNNVSKIFFAVYVLFFCLIICCFECGLDAIAKILAVNFGFLYTMVGRCFFIVFVGFMSFSLGTFGIAAMAIMFAVVLIHFYVKIKFPRFEEYLRKMHFFTREKPPAAQ